MVINGILVGGMHPEAQYIQSWDWIWACYVWSWEISFPEYSRKYDIFISYPVFWNLC